MKTNEDIYKELRKKLTDEEVVEGYLFNAILPEEEQKKAEEEFRKLRLEQLKNRTPEQILKGQLMQMQVQVKYYLNGNKLYDERFSFANQLRRYIKISTRSNKVIAENLSIHPTKLSRVLNNKENPNAELMHRLEKHSGDMIPAHYWWQLYAKELEHKIKNDLEGKISAADTVKQPLSV
ncbi:MAG: hypothetical protein AAGI23_12355 [Bacteroidota bacterium]